MVVLLWVRHPFVFTLGFLLWIPTLFWLLAPFGLFSLWFPPLCLFLHVFFLLWFVSLWFTPLCCSPLLSPLGVPPLVSPLFDFFAFWLFFLHVFPSPAPLGFSTLQPLRVLHFWFSPSFRCLPSFCFSLLLVFAPFLEVACLPFWIFSLFQCFALTSPLRRFHAWCFTSFGFSSLFGVWASPSLWFFCPFSFFFRSGFFFPFGSLLLIFFPLLVFSPFGVFLPFWIFLPPTLLDFQFSPRLGLPLLFFSLLWVFSLSPPPPFETPWYIVPIFCPDWSNSIVL